MIEKLENLSPITLKQKTVSESNKKQGEFVEKSDVEDGNTQTPAIKIITGTKPLRDILTLMTRSKNLFKIEEKSNGDVFWNGVFIQPLGENRINVKNEKYDISNIQKCFTDTKLTTNLLDNIEKEAVFDILNSVGSYDMKHTEGLNSTRMEDVLYNLP